MTPACCATPPRPPPCTGPRAGLSGPRPLVLMLHGCLQTPEDLARGTRMNEAAGPFGVYVPWPAQCAIANPMRRWNWFRPAERRRDAGEAGLLADLVREVMAAHPIDPARVYVAGLSAGAVGGADAARRRGALAAARGASWRQGRGTIRRPRWTGPRMTPARPRQRP